MTKKIGAYTSNEIIDDFETPFEGFLDRKRPVELDLGRLKDLEDEV
jgi:hypothetical protein